MSVGWLVVGGQFVQSKRTYTALANLWGQPCSSTCAPAKSYRSKQACVGTHNLIMLSTIQPRIQTRTILRIVTLTPPCICKHACCSRRQMESARAKIGAAEAQAQAALVELAQVPSEQASFAKVASGNCDTVGDGTCVCVYKCMYVCVYKCMYECVCTCVQVRACDSC